MTNTQSLTNWTGKKKCPTLTDRLSTGAGLAGRLLVRPDWAVAQLGQRKDGEMKV